MLEPDHLPVGVILAGGRGRRIGGNKATVALAGRPLLSYPLAAMRAALSEVVVVAKPSTALPPLPEGVAVWREPAQPSHPLKGIVHALRCAGGRAVLVCAGDMPFVTAEVLRGLARDPSGGPAVVAVGSDGELQPLLGRYGPEALGGLEKAAREGQGRLREIVAALGAVGCPVADGRVLFNVNEPEDLRRAEALLAADHA